MSASQDEIPPPPPPPPSSSQTPTQQTPHTVSTIKLPILKKGEYDIWAMKMEHYLAHTDYPIWEVIQNGNGPVSITTDTSGQIKVLPPRTAEEIVARERERKARTTLLMALPEDHLAKFHKMTDAKEMWDAIKSRFGGNDESKKIQKYILKQQFIGFSVSNTEGLHKGYDKFQSLLSQLEIHGAGVSTEDANQKFLRSLPSAWSQVSLIMRTKPGVDSLSFDDLYNNLRVFESDIKGSIASSSSPQNVAFVSENTSSTNEVSTAYCVPNLSGQNSKYEQTSSYSLLANQSSCPQLDHEDLEQIDEYDLEEMDLKWQVAMISMRMKKFYKKTGRKLQFDAKEPVGFDKTKVECYNCHKIGHFARECRIKGTQDNRRRDAWNSGNKDGSRTGQKEDSKALVTIDGEGVDWTNHSEDEDYALMACNSSDSDTEVISCTNKCKESYANLKKLYDAQREQLSDASIEIKAYSQGLRKVEAQLVAHQQGQLWYEQKIKFMKIDLDDKTDVLTYHKKLLAEAQKEKEDLKAKVEKWHNSSKNLSKLLNTQMSANDKFGLGYGDHRYDGILSYENEVLQSVFMNKESEIENQPLYDRFVTAEGMHAVPPPMTGNYMPSGPDVEVDDSKFTYGPKQTQPNESESQSSEFDTCESNTSIEPSELVSEPVVNESNVKSQPKVWSDAPIIEEYESDSDDDLNHLIRDCDFHEKRMARKAELNNGWNNVQRVNKQNQFVPSAVLTRTDIIPVNTARTSGTKNFSIAWQNINRQTVLTSTAMKVNTLVLLGEKGKLLLSPQHVVIGDHKDTIVDPNTMVDPVLEIDYPHRALKNKGIVDSGCSRHMTGNKAYLAEFQDKTLMGALMECNTNAPEGQNQYASITTPYKFFIWGQQRQLPNAGTEDIIDAGNSKKEDESAQDCFVMPIWPSYSSKITPYLKTDKKRGGPREEEQVFMDELERPKRQEKEAHGEAEALRKKFEQETENLVIQAGAARASTYLVSTAVLMRDYLCRDPTNLKKKMIQKYLYLRYLSKILLMDESWVDVCNEELLQFKIQKVWVLVDLPYGKKDIGTKWVYRNKKDEGGVVVINKASHKDLFGPLLIHEFYSLSMDVKKCLPLWENCGRGVGHTKVSHLSAVKRNFWVSKGQTPIWVFGILGDSVLGTCINADHGGYFYYIQLRWLLCASVRGLVLWILIKSLISLLPTITLSTTMAVLDSCPKHNMVAYLEKTDGNAEFHEIIDFLKRSSIHHALTDEGAPLEKTSEAQPTPSPAPTSEVPNEPQTDSSPAQTSEVPIEQQTDLSLRPSPTLIIPDSIPKTSGENLGGHSSSDKSLSENEGNMTLQSVYDLCLSLCAQVSDQAKEIQLLKAQIIKLKKQAKPVIKRHRAWLKSVSLKQRLTRKSFLKKQRVTKASVLTREGSEGRTRKMMGEDMEIDENYIVLMMLLSTDKEAVSTTRRKDRMTDQYHTRKEVLLSHSTLFYILVVDETIAKVLLNMSQAKAVSREKEKGRLSESVGILDAEIEVKQLESDEGLARKILEEWEEEEERKQIVKKKFQDEIPEGLEYSKLEATWFFKSTYLSDRDKISHSYAGREVDSYPSLILSYQVLWILPIPVRDLLFLYNYVSSDVAVRSFVPSGTVLNAFAEEIVAYEKDSNETHAIKKLNALCTPESFVTHSNFDTPGGTCLRFNNHELNVKEYKGIVKEREADEVSKYNYREFGDVVSFDATFKTNKFFDVVALKENEGKKKNFTAGFGLVIAIEETADMGFNITADIE
ncbi:ribonuclease H-like domain-containing protein [Tanacetum coccineum]